MTLPEGLIGRAVEMPSPCSRCRSTSASIGSGRGPHAASLMCNCGNHLGWLPQAAFRFIQKADRTLGAATSEPIVIRGALDHAKEIQVTKPQYDDRNRGALFRDDKKT